jgi:hypothetical protein
VAVAIAVVVAVITIAALLVTGGALLFLRVRTSPGAGASQSARMPTPVTAHSRLYVDGGTVVFTDGFHDPSSGWPTGTTASGSSYQYSNAGYVIVGKGTLHHLAPAPHTRPLMQLSIAVSASQTGDTPDGSGFGVTCDTGEGSTELQYTLIVEQPGTWYLERSYGPVALTNLIKQGPAQVTPGVRPLSITGMCATLADGHTTRLALFVNGVLVADATDSSNAAVHGWVGGIVASSRAGQVTTVTFMKFEERDLSGTGG